MIQTARENGLYIDKKDWSSFGERKRLPSGESIIYLNETESAVYKIRDPFAKGAIKDLNPFWIIYEHIIHNLLFPDTRYDFIGISEDESGIKIILRQPYLDDQYIIPSQKEIDEYLEQGLGLSNENRYFYGNEFVAVTDVSCEGDNVLSDGETLFFIDPIIKMKKDPLSIINHYLHNPQS